MSESVLECGGVEERGMEGLGEGKEKWGGVKKCGERVGECMR